MRASRVCALAIAALLLAGGSARAADKEFPVKGMVIQVDQPGKWFAVSHEQIVGFMDAMTMPFEVRQVEDLKGVVPGAIVEFTLVVGENTAYATRISVRRYETVEQDPRTAKRLSVMKRMAGLTTPPVALGARVPDFVLTDQRGRRVSLSNFIGKLVVLNFVYTRCALPQFCLRMSNNFGALQKRFAPDLGKDLVLLTVTFDPERDTPEVLAEYASRWQADPSSWRFLTGSAEEIRRACALFGQEAFADEGLMNHSLHTVVIGRTGLLVANIEGNRFTAEQLGDLVLASLRR